MATETEELVLSISADTAQIKRALHYGCITFNGWAHDWHEGFWRRYQSSSSGHGDRQRHRPLRSSTPSLATGATTIIFSNIDGTALGSRRRFLCPQPERRRDAVAPAQLPDGKQTRGNRRSIIFEVGFSHDSPRRRFRRPQQSPAVHHLQLHHLRRFRAKRRKGNDPVLISLPIYVLVVGLIVGLVYWIADAVPLPQPLNKIVKLVAVVIGVLIRSCCCSRLVNGTDPVGVRRIIPG